MNTPPVNLPKEFSSPLPNSINSVYDLEMKPRLIRYYHATSWFPTKSNPNCSNHQSTLRIMAGTEHTLSLQILPRVWWNMERTQQEVKIRTTIHNTSDQIRDHQGWHPETFKKEFPVLQAAQPQEWIRPQRVLRSNRQVPHHTIPR